MKISFSRDYGTVTLAIDEDNSDEDVLKCQKIQKLMESEEWMAVLQLFAAVEQKYDEAVMKVKPQEQSFRETAIFAARKNGFCEAVKLMGKALQAFKEYRAVKLEELNERVENVLSSNGVGEDLVVNE